MGLVEKLRQIFKKPSPVPPKEEPIKLRPLANHGDRTVFLVPDSDSSEEKVQKTAAWMFEGVVSEGCRALTPEEWKRELDAARASDCFCGLIYCVCNQVRNHKPECRFRRAMTCAIPISCYHEHDVCPECDPCTCKEPP